MKILILQSVFRLPDNFKMGRKGDEALNRALEELLAYRRSLPKRRQGKESDQYKNVTTMWKDLLQEQLKPNSKRHIGQSALTTLVWPPKPAPKKRQTR